MRPEVGKDRKKVSKNTFKLKYCTSKCVTFIFINFQISLYLIRK